MTHALRDYQQSGIDAIRAEFTAGHKRVLLCMPTGAGKTLTASEMVRGNFQRGKRMLWLTDREELADQASEAFEKAGVTHGHIMAGYAADKFASAWVGTIQSFLAWRKPGSRRWTPDRVDLIVIDEAHRTEADSFQQMLAEYPDAFVVGLTATPMRGDGRGLGRTYNGMTVPVTMRELLERGLLVPARYFVPSSADYTKLQRIKAGDFSSAELSMWADANPQLVGDAVENFARVCPERRAVAFPPNIKTSVALAERFNVAGISAVHVDGKMKKPERREAMRQFRSGEVQILSSVNIAIEGLDVPDVSAVLMLRPTKSERIWIQAVGRGLRSMAGKTDCIAEGSLVLTDQGLVKIEEVTTEMRVWDGLNWVSHRGTVCRGIKNVIYYAGLTATPDHRVWTQKGWAALGDCAAQQIPIAQTGFGGQEIREGKYFVAGSGVARPAPEQKDVRAYDMPNVWQTSLDFIQQSLARTYWGLSCMWAISISPRMALQTCSRDAATLSESEPRQVHGLRGARNSISVFISSCRSALDSRTPWGPERQAIGQNRQRGALRTGQYSLVNRQAKSSTHTQNASQPKAAFIQARTPGSAVCGFNFVKNAWAGFHARGNMSAVGATVQQTERRVWDILEAGPLHRFTVSGVLVHNCVVLDHAGILQEFGPAEDFVPPELHAKPGKETKGSASAPRKPAQVVCGGEFNGSACGTVLIGTNVCPTCGTELEYDPAGQPAEVLPGQLEELTAEGRQQVAFDLAEKRRWYAELLGCAHLRGKNPGSVFYRYQSKFGEKPPYAWKADVSHEYPSAEVQAFWKSQDIAYARSRNPQKGRAA